MDLTSNSFGKKGVLQSVGRGQVNNPKDVEIVQMLLNGCLYRMGPLVPLRVDGRIGANTIARLERFQSSFVSHGGTTGELQPRDDTMRRLIDVSRSPDPGTIASVLRSMPFARYVFPLGRRPAEICDSGMRQFGWRRDGGRRKHAGCDMYAPVGTPVFAMDDGVITQVAPFYLGTEAVVVRHPDFVARYGEVTGAAAGLRVGSAVRKGQLIAYVGKLQGYHKSMLHLELFSGLLFSGRLTQMSKPPFNRRADLIDPVPILKLAQ